MNKQTMMTRITLWMNRLTALAVLTMLIGLQPLIDWYCTFRVLTEQEQTAISIAFYACAAVIFYALWNMEWLLKAILRGDVFVPMNVRRIRRVQWCCGLVSLICIPASFAYVPLAFIAAIMAFLFLAVSVVACVMDSAVSLREENDLTI
jgi:hypothetical protein